MRYAVKGDRSVELSYPLNHQAHVARSSRASTGMFLSNLQRLQFLIEPLRDRSIA